MSGAHPEPTEPRIIKKKKVQGGGAHGGAWKVAYADFVTAMMALFIVLWIMSQSQSIRENVAQYFKNPGLLPGASGLMETSDLGGEIPTPGHSQDLQTPAPIKPDLASQRSSLEEVKKRLTEIIAQLPELSRLKDQIALEITDEGLRIELMDKENSHFFDLGSANLKPETRQLLKLIAQELGKLPNSLTVEGHTDSRPYGTKSYTNWELSADRANAARRLMEDNGIRTGQVTSVRGCADRQLRNPKDPLDFQNRRVSILVRFQDKTSHEPVDLQKIQEDVHKDTSTKNQSQENKVTSTPTAASAPEVPETTVPPSPATPPVKPPTVSPAGQDGAESPGAKSTGAEKPLAGEPEKAHEPLPVPEQKSIITPPPLRLEDQVRDEVRQMLQQEGLPGSTPENGADPSKEPRLRLGW
jgi:chemotaxis protein MotB